MGLLDDLARVIDDAPAPVRMPRCGPRPLAQLRSRCARCGHGESFREAPSVDDAVIKASAWISARDGLGADTTDRIPVHALIVEEESHANISIRRVSLIEWRWRRQDPPGTASRRTLTFSCAAHTWHGGTKPG
jgi:hypothetical protein